jgi:hypothetical protein
MGKKYEVVYESNVKVVNEQRAIIVQAQEGKTVPVTVISQMYPVDDGGEWGFCSPRVSGAVSFRLAMSSRQIGWLIDELEKVMALVEKAEKAATKSTKTKSTKSTKATKKAVVEEDDVELEVSSSRTTRRIRR